MIGRRALDKLDVPGRRLSPDQAKGSAVAGGRLPQRPPHRVVVVFVAPGTGDALAYAIPVPNAARVDLGRIVPCTSVQKFC